MIIQNRDDYINYRLQRAKESFEEALILYEKQKWNATINRLYYASFYAVIALLIKNNIETTTHDGTRTQFSLKFIKTGVIDTSYGKLFSKLYDLRQKGDYGDMFDFDKESVSELIDPVKNFIKKIEDQLNI